MSKKLLILLCVMFLASNAFSQIIPNVLVFERDSSIVDSLRTAEYPYIFPFWGEKVQKKGIQLPKSAGLSAQYIWQESDIVIDNLRVGINNGPPVELGEAVRFNSAVVRLNGINIRPDIWVLPFLNVYGLFAMAKTSTEIEASISIPDSGNNWREITSISTIAEFDATTFGFGFTPTIGVGGGWVALDFNFSWSDIAALSEPAFAWVFGPRVGKTFKFGRTGEMELAVWVGGFRLDIAGGTDGSLDLAGLFPIDELTEKVEQGLIKVGEAQQEIDTWWDGLTPVEQKNPGNVARYEMVNRILGKTGTVLNNLEGSLSNAGTATVQYALDKRQANKWNFLVGAQFQLNRSWMIRAEYGFLGSRQQFIGGLQYRFGL